MSDRPNQIALITGASRGFGHAAATALGSSGTHVVAVARTVGGLEDLDDAIQTAGGSATLVPLDICDDAGLGRMGAALFERFGRVDLWLHTACHTPPLCPSEHADAKDFDKALAVNVRAFQRLIRVVDPLLRLASAPAAVVLSDDCTDRKFFGSYAASKAAQSALTRAWAAESGSKIAISEYQPPPMPTAHRARFFPGEDRSRLTTCDTAVADWIASRA
ncbi:MAG: SDR family oxidoreductase [Pseudomonadota bacterium]